MVIQHPGSTPQFPTLDHGIHLLDTDRRASKALHSLVLDHLLLNEGGVLWVDSHGHGTTHYLAKLAPSMRTLKRIRIARGFTAFQHYSLVEDLPAAIDSKATLVVAPAFDWSYRSDDLRRGEGETMLTAALAVVEELIAEFDLPVLLTRYEPNGIGQALESVADEHLRCDVTKFGPRFHSDGFETLVYPGDGYVQTTFAYWRRVLAARHPAYETRPTEVTVGGSH